MIGYAWWIHSKPVTVLYTRYVNSKPCSPRCQGFRWCWHWQWWHWWSRTYPVQTPQAVMGFYGFLQGMAAHGSLNVPIEHHPTMKGIWSTRWLLFQVMFNIPKMGQLPTPAAILHLKMLDKRSLSQLCWQTSCRFVVHVLLVACSCTVPNS